MRWRTDNLKRLLLIAFLGYLATGLCAQEAIQNPDDDLPLLKPTNTFDLPLMDLIYPLKEKSDTSDSMVAFTNTMAINIWSLAVYYWPEALGIVSLVLLLICLWRWLRFNLIVGQPHCRKCHYSLIAFEGDTCPECGVELTEHNRIIGRRFGWRMVICLIMSAIVLVGYLPGRKHLPRQGWFADRYEILSPRVYRWLFNWNTLRSRHSKFLQRFVEIDVATGRLIREITTRAGRQIHSEFTFDRKAAVMRHGLMIQLFDLSNGQCLADFDMVEQAGEYLDHDANNIVWMAMGNAPEILYLSTRNGSIQAWNLVDGEVEILTKTDGLLSRLYVIPSDNRLGMLFRETPNGWEWLEFDLQSRQFVKTIRSENGRSMHSMILSSDGTRIALCERDRSWLEIWDRRVGELLQTFELSELTFAQFSPMAMSADNRWVLAGTGTSFGMLSSTTQLYVFDTTLGICAARLDVPIMSFSQTVLLPDNKTAVIIGRDQNKQAKMLVYDLSQLTAD